MDPTHEVGSNGIADIIWEGGCPKSTASKSSVGERLHGTSVRFVPTAGQGISFAVAANARPFSNGRITRLSNLGFYFRKAHLSDMSCSQSYVCFWHLADIDAASENVRF